MGQENKKPYHHGNLRSELLEAASRLLSEKGPDELSLREVARRAQVSANAPYRHFPNRDALLAALAEEGFAALKACFEKHEQESPSIRLSRFGGEYYAFAKKEPARFRLMFSGLMGHENVQRSSSECFGLLVAAVSSLMPPETTFRGVAKTAYAYWGAIHGLAILATEGVEDYFGLEAVALPEELLEVLGGLKLRE